MNTFQPWQLLLVSFSGWVNRHQLDVITYIQEENRILKSKLKRLRRKICTDDQGVVLESDDLLRREVATKGNL